MLYKVSKIPTSLNKAKLCSLWFLIHMQKITKCSFVAHILRQFFVQIGFNMLFFLEFLLNYMQYFCLWVIIIKLPLLSSFYSFLFPFLLFFLFYFPHCPSFFFFFLPLNIASFFFLYVDIPNYSLYLSKYLIFFFLFKCFGAFWILS